MVRPWFLCPRCAVVAPEVAVRGRCKRLALRTASYEVLTVGGSRTTGFSWAAQATHILARNIARSPPPALATGTLDATSSVLSVLCLLQAIDAHSRRSETLRLRVADSALLGADSLVLSRVPRVKRVRASVWLTVASWFLVSTLECPLDSFTCSTLHPLLTFSSRALRFNCIVYFRLDHRD